MIVIYLHREKNLDATTQTVYVLKYGTLAMLNVLRVFCTTIGFQGVYNGLLDFNRFNIIVPMEYDDILRKIIKEAAVDALTNANLMKQTIRNVGHHAQALAFQ